MDDCSFAASWIRVIFYYIIHIYASVFVRRGLIWVRTTKALSVEAASSIDSVPARRAAKRDTKKLNNVKLILLTSPILVRFADFVKAILGKGLNVSGL